MANSAPTGAGDFDFLHGKWNVDHRRLKARNVGSADWESFRGTAETRPFMGGVANVEQHDFFNDGSAGLALRLFDPDQMLWSIYWASSRDGLLQPPVVGKFFDGEGMFYGRDFLLGAPIQVRFRWHGITGDAAKWEQAFSIDDGASWEVNWTMDFTRAA